MLVVDHPDITEYECLQPSVGVLVVTMVAAGVRGRTRAPAVPPPPAGPTEGAASPAPASTATEDALR